MGRACERVDWDERLPCLRERIERAELSVHYTRGIRLRGGECGALVELGAADQVATDCDAVGHAGIGEEKREERNVSRQIN